MDVTRGPGAYQQSVLGFDTTVSKTVSFGLGYTITGDTVTSVSPTKTLSLNVGVNPAEHFSVGMSVSNSPQNGDLKSSGWGVNGSYNGGRNNLDWGFSLALNNAVTSEYVSYQTLQDRQLGRSGKTSTTTTDHDLWIDLRQNNVQSSGYLGLFGLVTVSCGYTKYAYDRDLRDFSQQLAQLSASPVLQNADFGSVSSLIDGFPDHIVSAGMYVSPLKNLQAGLDWSRTNYVLDQPPEDSSTLTLSYAFLSKLVVKAGTSILAGRDRYTTLGLRWQW